LAADEQPVVAFLSHPQGRDSGDYSHRVTQPGQALAAHLRVIDLQTSHPDSVAVALKADLLVVTMVADPVVASLIALRKQAGLPTAYEISDDFADFPPNLPAHAFYAQPQIQVMIEGMARDADLLQCSSHGLLRKYAALNARHAVFPNQLTEVPELPERRRIGPDHPVLGWSGSAGHLDDARRLAQLVQAWWRQRGKQPPGGGPSIRIMSSPRICGVFEAAGCLVDYRPSGGFKDYLAFLDGIDIGFAVIGDTDFSTGRSDGKFLELASRGVVCVASDAGEYPIGMRHGQTGLLFTDEPGFIAALDDLFDSPTRLAQIRSAAHAWVRTERTHERGAIERLRHYLPLLQARSGRGLPHTVDFGADPGQPPGSGLIVMADASEAAFLAASGLHNAGQLEAALTGYLQIIEQRPDFYLPWQRCADIARALGGEADALHFEQTAIHQLELQVRTALSVKTGSAGAAV
jgi:hypothetical protein